MRLFQEVEASALVCSASCGADLIALRVASALKLRRRIVLPFAPEQFRETSVTDRPDEQWGGMFDQAISEAKAEGELVVLTGAGDHAQAYAAANEALIQEARTLASTLQRTTPRASLFTKS
ncbi:MAG TPA: hypothetical protein VF815_01835 [Myxococcaceae bacterium]